VRYGTKFSSLSKNEYRVVARMPYTISHDKNFPLTDIQIYLYMTFCTILFREIFEIRLRQLRFYSLVYSNIYLNTTFHRTTIFGNADFRTFEVVM
jgi:hypothetical protein